MKFIYAALGALLLLAGPDLAADVPPGPNGDLPDALCDYPDGPKTFFQISTLLVFTGASDGALVDVAVQRPSGDPVQDTAAIACARQWHFDPATALGKLNLGRHRLNMGWDQGAVAGGKPVLHRIAIPHLCTQDYLAEPSKAAISGTTIVRFTITVEGAVRDPSIDISSGNAFLDAASLTCARDWRYRPAVKDGQPIAVPWRAQIDWRVVPVTFSPTP
jgi:TonB family protein